MHHAVFKKSSFSVWCSVERVRWQSPPKTHSQDSVRAAAYGASARARLRPVVAPVGFCEAGIRADRVSASRHPHRRGPGPLLPP
eukprot:scaffold10686_cov63-Phaeocystis_antarctica.AAC.1